RRHPAVVWAAGLVTMLALVSLVVVFQVRQQAAVDRAKTEEQARKQLELQLYYQTVGLAEREIAAGNAGRAEELLDGPHCPPHLRGWEWHYLKRLRFGGVAPIRCPTFLWCVAVSPDGQWLAAGGIDGIVRLWNVKTGKEVRKLQGHSDEVKGLAFSPDNQHLASASNNGVVKVWSVPAGTLLASLPHGRGTWRLAFHPDGSKLVSCGTPSLKVWDTATWQELPVPPGLSEDVQGIAFSPDGQLLATGSWEGMVKVWETATW